MFAILWDYRDPAHNNKQRRSTVKEQLITLFNSEYSVLENTFHSLHTCMSRELKKESEASQSKRKWIRYVSLQFLKEELGSFAKSKTNFEDLEQYVYHLLLGGHLERSLVLEIFVKCSVACPWSLLSLNNN